MVELYHKLKQRFGQEKIIMKSEKIIEVIFKNSEEPVVIHNKHINRFSVSYPELKEKVDTYSTINNISEEGVFWILYQVKKNGKVLPEF